MNWMHAFFTYRNKIKVNSKEEEEFHNRIELIKELKKKEYKCQQFEYNYSYQSYRGIIVILALYLMNPKY
jgi:hypothetical protein